VDAFTIWFEGKYTQHDFLDTGTADQKELLHFIRPSLGEPPLYLEPSLSAAAFFSDVAVEINGIPVEQSSLGKNAWLFQVFNRVFQGDKVRRQKYDSELVRVTNENDRKIGNKDNSPDLKAALTMMDHDARRTTKWKMMRFGTDLVWPLDTQSNTCRALSGVVNQNGYLPPSTTVKITLTKRDPIGACVENASIPDDVYYTDTVVSEVAQIWEAQWNIKQFELTYESLTLSSQERMDKIRREATQYYVDKGQVLFQEVSPGQSFTVNTVHVPAGARFLGLFFAQTNQISFNPAQKKPLSARFNMIPGADHVDYEMDGKPLLFEKGLDKPGVHTQAHVSRSCADLHRYMVHAQLYSRPFDSMFPTAGYGDDVAVIIDLGDKVIPVPTTMTVSVKYTNTSPAHWYLCSVSCQQYLYTLKDKEAIKATLLI
jgi:hypothetical protein